ncbi:MAG: glutamate--tRNA ligase [Patescibacteria group bacterium]
MKIVTRFPPSPTGPLHIGSARTALFNYLFAQNGGGKMILRFEDTDKTRSKKEFEEDIFEGLNWLGMNCSEVFHQSERILVYRKYLEKLLAEEKAYYSDESKVTEFKSENDDSEDPSETLIDAPLRVIRLKNLKKVIIFNDIVRGEISIDTTELGDFIIARSIEEPLYHFAVVVDDFEMEATHIIRGEDGIYNTPRQILIQEAIGAPRPSYCHIPFVLGEDKSKLSKRHGAVSVNEYKMMGILPDAFLNYLALLGWNPGTTKEIFTREELIKEFSLSKIQKSGAVFSIEKLRWINREHLKKMSLADFKKLTLNYIPKEITSLPEWSEDRLTRLLPDLKERIYVLKEISDLGNGGDLSYIFDKPQYKTELLLPKKNKSNKNILSTHLEKVINLIEKIDASKTINKDTVKEAIWDYANEKGRGDVLWPMRVALSGKEKSPDPFTLSEILGKEATLSRLQNAISLLKG